MIETHRLKTCYFSPDNLKFCVVKKNYKERKYLCDSGEITKKKKD